MMRTNFLKALREFCPTTWLAIPLIGLPVVQGLVSPPLQAAPPVVVYLESGDNAADTSAVAQPLMLVAQAPETRRDAPRDAASGPWIPMAPGAGPFPGMMGPGRMPMRPGSAPAMRGPSARPEGGPGPGRESRGAEPERGREGEAKPDARRESPERRETTERRELLPSREPTPDRGPMPDRAQMPNRGPAEQPGMVPGRGMPPMHAPMQGPMAGHPMMPGPVPGGAPGPGGSIEEHLRAVERLFESPFIRRHLELIAENTHLKAQLEMQERLHMQQRERQGDQPRVPNQRAANAEREQDERAAQAARERAARERAERAERERHENAQRGERGGNEADKLRDQVAKLEAQLQEMRAASEKAKRAMTEMTEQREQWMRKMHAEMEQRMQEALRRGGIDGKPREATGDRPKRKEAD